MGTQRFTNRPTRSLGAIVLLLAAATSASAQQSPGDAAARGTPRPRVTVIGTGGTMAGASNTRTSFQSYRAGQIPIGDMVYTLKPQIDSVADVTTVQFGNAGSGSYRIVDYYDLTLAIDKALETADAVVVTTGTGTMDEFVYWADLTVRSQKPVVFTGAMRPWTVIGSDAPANLFNAIVLAASRATTCFGSVLMLNDEFHAAKDAWKSDELRMDTFVSRQVGALGYVDGLRVRTWRAPPRIQRCATPETWRTPFDLRTISRDQLPRVEVLIGYQGAGLDEAVAAWADAGVKGIVVSGGGVTAAARRAAEEKGVTFATTYRFRTGGDNLYPEKARLLLLLSLAFTKDPAQVTRWLTELGGDEFEPTLPPG